MYLLQETIRQILLEASLDKMRNIGVPPEASARIHDLAQECGNQSFWFAQQMQVSMHQWDQYIRGYKAAQKNLKKIIKIVKNKDEERFKEALLSLGNSPSFITKSILYNSDPESTLRKRFLEAEREANVNLRMLLKIIDEKKEAIEIICQWANETKINLSKKKFIKLQQPDGKMKKVEFDMATAERAAYQHFGIQEGTIFMTFENDWYWLDRETNTCSIEAKIMQHCGRTDQSDSTLWSLRDEHGMPFVTAEIKETDEGRTIYQMKGKQNSAPDQKYHEYIYKLLTDENFKLQHYSAVGKHGGDLLWENIPENIREEIEELDTWEGVGESSWIDRIDQIYTDFVEENGQFKTLSPYWDASSAEELEDGTEYLNVYASLSFEFSSNDYRISPIADKLELWKMDTSAIEKAIPGFEIEISTRPPSEANEWAEEHRDTKLSVDFNKTDSEYATSENEFLDILSSLKYEDQEIHDNIKKIVEIWLYENEVFLKEGEEDVYESIVGDVKFNNFRWEVEPPWIKLSSRYNDIALPMDDLVLINKETTKVIQNKLWEKIQEGAKKIEKRSFVQSSLPLKGLSQSKMVLNISQGGTYNTPPTTVVAFFDFGIYSRDLDPHQFIAAARWLDQNWDSIIYELHSLLKELPLRYPLDDKPKSWDDLRASFKHYVDLRSVLGKYKKSTSNNISLSFYDSAGNSEYDTEGQVSSYDIPSIDEEYNFTMKLAMSPDAKTYKEWFQWLPQEIKRYIDANKIEENALRIIIRNVYESS